MLGIITATVYIVILVILLVIDYKYHIIPNKVVYPAIVAALALSYFGMGIGPSLIGGVIGFGIMLVPKLAFKVKTGMGDVKLALLVGLMVGYPLMVVNILLVGVLSILLCAWLLVTKRRKASDLLPYGSLLCVATIITIIRGYEIWQLIAR